MGSKWIALAGLALAVGCGTATVKPDPPLDDTKKNEISLKNLASEDPVQRGIAAASIGSLGAAGKQYLPDLKKLENDSDANVRERVKEAIQKIEKGG